MKKEIRLGSPEETFQFGKKLASFLVQGGFVALYGDLGSGKSVIARGIADHLGVKNIASPTFTIMQRYDTAPLFYHIDAYRLSNADELYDIGYEECLKKGVLVVLEWANIVSSALPDKRIDIYLTGSGAEPREACIVCDEEMISKEFFQGL